MSDIFSREEFDRINSYRLHMDTSDSSDDEKGSNEGRRSKLKIIDVFICHVRARQNCKFLYDYRRQRTMNILLRKKIIKQKKQKQKQKQLNQQNQL